MNKYKKLFEPIKIGSCESLSQVKVGNNFI